MGCTLTDKGDGTQELTCGDVTITLGDKCEEGFKADLVVGKPADSSGKTISSPTYTPGQDLSLQLFEMTNRTWVRGQVVSRSRAT